MRLSLVFLLQDRGCLFWFGPLKIDCLSLVGDFGFDSYINSRVLLIFFICCNSESPCYVDQELSSSQMDIDLDAQWKANYCIFKQCKDLGPQGEAISEFLFKVCSEKAWMYWKDNTLIEKLKMVPKNGSHSFVTQTLLPLSKELYF